MAIQYGLTAQGFVVKQQQVIISEIQNQLRSLLGENINLLPRAVFGQIVGVFSEREALLWQLGEAIYISQYPEGAEGASVDNILALNGLKRLPATFSRTPNGAPLVLKGTPGTFIAAGSLVLINGISSAPPFKTVTDVTIAPSVNAVQTLIFTAVPDSGNFSISIGASTTSLLPYTANAAAIQAAINLLPGYSSVTVSGSFGTTFTVTFGGSSGAQAQPLMVIPVTTLRVGSTVVNISVSNTVAGLPAQGTTLGVCTQTGPVFAPAGTLTVIGTPISGWASVTNPLDSIVGTNIETDTEALTRRANLLASQGNGPLQAIVERVQQVSNVTQALGFENLGIFPDLAGRPPKCFEIVANGGIDADIAQVIYGSKPAGIQSYGNTGPIAITDNFGFEHDIFFSRPTLVPVYMTLKLFVNSQFDPTQVQQIQEDLVDVGNALQIGQTVIVFGSKGLIGCFNSVLGIVDYEFGIGITPNPPLGQTANVPMGPEQLAAFDTSRIIVSFG